MEKWSQLLNVHTDPDRRRSLKEQALRWLAGFLVLMVFCTLLSRAADSLTVASVSAEKPSRSPIVHTVEAQGTLEAEAALAVSAAPGLRVSAVPVAQGAGVSAGDVLFTVDQEDLAEQLETARLQLQRAALQMQAGQSAAEKGGARAQEDYETAQAQGEFLVDQAESDLAVAQRSLRRFKDQYDYILDGWHGTAMPGDEDYDILSQYESLRQAVRSAQRSYDDAQLQQEKLLRDAQRAIEDAGDSTEAQAAAIDWRLQQLTVAKLQKLADAGGAVLAPADGTVTKVGVSVGQQTGSEAAVLLADPEAGLSFSAPVARDDLDYLKQGGAARVELASRKTAQGTIVGVEETADGSGRVTVRLEGSVGEPGASAAMTVAQKSEAYETCVPLSALRSDGNEHYVLVIRETQSVLGTQMIAERVDVRILDRNEQKAAVEGALFSEDQVITSSSKSIGAGDRVRLSGS